MSTPEELESEADYERAIEGLTHEPECPKALLPQISVGAEHLWCDCEIIRAAYRRGYNDHASSRAKAEAFFGKYQNATGGNP